MLDKVPTNDIPQAENENIESSKLEWGPEFSPMSYFEAKNKIEKLNSNLTEGKKPWRLPTKDELVTEFKKTGLNSKGGSWHWSDTDTDISYYAYIVNMDNGKLGKDRKDTADNRVHLVR